MSNAPGLPSHYAARRAFYENVLLDDITLWKPETSYEGGLRRDRPQYSVNLDLAVRVGQFNPAILTDLARRIRPTFGAHFSIHMGSRADGPERPSVGEFMTVSFDATPEIFMQWVRNLGMEEWQADWRYNSVIPKDEQRERREQELRPAVERWLLFREEGDRDE